MAAYRLPILLLAVVAAVNLPAFRYPTFNPELALFYVDNSGMTAAGLLDQYLNWGHGFFRPTAYFSYFKVVTALFDWHDIAAFKVVAVLLLTVVAVQTFFLARTLLGTDDRVAALVAAVSIAVNPVTYIQVYEALGMDIMYQIVVLACIQLACGRAIEGRRRIAAAAGVCLLFAFGLTCKEQVIAFPAFLALWLLLRRPALGRPSTRLRIALVAVTGALTLAYLYGHFMHLQPTAVGAYRTEFNAMQVLINLITGPLWITHIFRVSNPTWEHINALNHPLANLLGLAVLAVTAGHVVAVLRRGDRAELDRLLMPLGMAVVFLVVPVYSGGRPWHYALSAVGYVILFGRAVSQMAARLPEGGIRTWAPAVPAAVLVLAAYTDIGREIHSRMPLFRVNAEAMLHPPVPPAEMPETATILYADGGDVWHLGVNRLFRFAYENPKLTEWTVADIDAIPSDRARAWLERPDAYYFAYDNGAIPHWRDATAELRRKLESRLAQEEQRAGRS